MFSRLRYIFRTFSTKRITVDPQELKNFDQMAVAWWDPNGTSKPLFSLNNCRIPWIKNQLIQTGTNKVAPWEGLAVLDVGCGGGILTEALSRLGCIATGLDPNEKLIKVAHHHAKTQNMSNLKYECATIQEHAIQNTEKYDVVVSSECIEHVTEKEEFVKYCVKCLKPGGSLFMTTPNKTWLSRLCAIFMMENVLKLLPKGTHRYDMFIHLKDLKNLMEKEKCEIIFTSGLIYNPSKDEWFLIKNENVSYVIHAVKRS